jgi:hypothetical protein
LVGSFNNDWAIRLSDKLRFYFEMDPKAGEHWIADKQKPEKKIGRRVPSVGAVDGKNAFAIISRVKDPDTRQMVVSVAGLSGYGTRAAGRFVSDPSYLTEFSQNAPPNWQNANLQIVIEAPIVDRELAAPHVIDSYVW